MLLDLGIEKSPNDRASVVDAVGEHCAAPRKLQRLHSAILIYKRSQTVGSDESGARWIDSVDMIQGYAGDNDLLIPSMKKGKLEKPVKLAIAH